MVLGFGLIGDIISKIKNKKQEGAITDPWGKFKTNKGTINYTLVEGEDFSNLPQNLQTFNPAINKTASPNITNTEDKPVNVPLLGRTQSTGGGDLTTKEGINTNTLLIVGGVVLLAIFVLPMFVGGKK